MPLFEYLEFDFLREYGVFAPCERGRTRVYTARKLFRGVLYCYYEDVYGTRPVTRELQKPLIWLSCGFDRPPSRDAVDRFLTDLEHVSTDVFDHFVEQAATCGLLESTYRIDSTHIEAILRNDEASWNSASTAEENYYGFGCTIVSTGAKNSHHSRTHTGETDRRRNGDARDALAVAQPIWMIGDSAK